MPMCACTVGERSLGVYKAYYWLTAALMVLMFVIAAWFVCLVAVNTTGAASILTPQAALAPRCNPGRACCHHVVVPPAADSKARDMTCRQQHE